MEQINVITKKVDVFPMAKYYIDQLGIYDLFAKYVLKPKGCPVELAQILSTMLKWETDHKAIMELVVRDGIFPLITNL